MLLIRMIAPLVVPLDDAGFCGALKRGEWEMNRILALYQLAPCGSPESRFSMIGMAITAGAWIAYRIVLRVKRRWWRVGDAIESGTPSIDQ